MKKQLRKLMTCLLAVAMVLSSLMASPDGIYGILGMVQTAHAATITPSKPEGDGSAEHPYQIKTAAELYWFVGLVNGDASVCTGEVAQNPAANAVLTADIIVNKNVLDADWNCILDKNTAIVWTPIGSQTGKYQGTFEGNGHTISGLYFGSNDLGEGSSAGSEEGSYVGLFGSVGSNGSVSNVGVEDSYFFPYGNYVSGLCGENEGAIEGCYFRGNVRSRYYVGGVCGRNLGSIRSCYVSAKVAGSNYVGAVCGANDGNEGENVTIEDCYYDKTIASDVASAVGQTAAKVRNVLGKTTERFAKGEVTYLLNGSTSTDNPIWGQKIGTDTYPVFYNGTNKVYATKGCVIYNNTGDESQREHAYGGANGRCACGKYEEPDKDENGVYQISKASHLYWFADYANTENANANAVLTDDIIVNRNVLDKDGKLILNNASATVWTPIGSETVYRGTFDGNGHTISGLYFYNESTDDVGLFSCVGEGGSVSNVGILDSYFYGHFYVGGVCGKNDGTVKQCYFMGDVDGSRSGFGGVCGENFGTIEDCYYNNTFATYLEAVYDNYGKIMNVYGKTIAQFASGEVTWLLNGSTSTGNPVWGQTLTGGEPDAHPVSHTADNTVYATKGCVTYNNTGDASEKEHGVDENGRCSGCGMRFISTKEQLFSFAEAVDNGESYINAVLTEDITVNETVLDAEGNLVLDTASATVWTPIGREHLYTGAFDGNGHTISGLYFSDGNVDAVGLFAHVGEGGSVSNVAILDSYFYGHVQIGGVSGYNKGTIRNCYYIGVVGRSSSRCGSICGLNYGTVKNCYYNKTINPNCGAVDYNYGTIKDVLGKTTAQFASGEVTCLLNDSASAGNPVWGQTLTGDTPDGHPVCYNGTNKVSATKGCVGYNNTGDASEKEHVIGENGICTVCGTHIISTKEQLISFAKAVNDGDTNLSAVLTDDITVNENVLDKDGKLILVTESATVWTPIGSEYKAYSGTFDGRGHTISGLYFSDESQYYVGLFGNVEEAGVISNVNVADSYLRGGRYVGGVCGCNYGTIKAGTNTGTVSGSSKYVGGVCGYNNGTIEASTNTGAVSGDSEDVGGVCGYNNRTIEASTNTGAVSGDSEYVGGVCGRNYGTIQGCRNSGSVTGINYIGGVCGENNYATLEGICNTGAVNGDEYIGGVCGYNDEGSIEASYNTGSVSGSYRVGGVCGYNNDYGRIKASYSAGSVSGSSEYVGGVCGRNYGTIRDCYYNSDICTVGAVKLEDVEGKAVGLTTLQMTAPDALATMNFSSEVWEKKPADTQQMKAFYPGLTAIEDDEEYISYEAEIAFKNTNTNTNLVYGDDLTFTLDDVTVKFDGMKESVSIIKNCTAEDFKLLYRGENIGSITVSDDTITALVSEAVDAGSQTITLQYVGSRYDILSGLTGDCNVTIGKATPTVTSPSANNEITYGKKLSDVVLSDTKWSWVDKTELPTVTNNGYKAVMSVTDYDNYDYSNVADYDETTHTIIRTIAVKVNKSQNTPNMPSLTMNVENSVTKVSDVTLPAGWTWQDADKEKALTVGTAVKATAVYTGADQGNYETESVEISITRAECTHTATTPQLPKKGDVVADDKASVTVEVTDVAKKEVEYKEPTDKKAKTVSIPATVKINGVTYKVTKIADNAFKNNKTVTKVTVGSNIKTIGKNAFYKCTKLKTVKIGKNVTTIGSNAFKGCTSLTSVTLPSKATKIGANAFSGCKKLKTIKITSTKLTSKTVAKNAFKGLTKATTIKVPKKKLSAYKKLFKQKGLSSKVKVKGY